MCSGKMLLPTPSLKKKRLETQRTNGMGTLNRQRSCEVQKMSKAKWMSITKVRESIVSKSSEEVTASYLKIIKKSKINGYVTINEGAIARAQEIDKNDLN